ncbi:MAG TPA: hypothetical protein VML75_10070, partial [Kofleriaceae bacterium]|nr:hypothetical protein [Kofleriaceae bacterium]
MFIQTRSSLFMALLAALAFTAAPACVGQAPGPDLGDPDPNDPDPNDPDPTDPDPDPQSIDVTGMVMDYFIGDPLANAQVQTEGIAPALQVASETTGAYSLADVPAGSTFFVTANYSTNYYPTRSMPITVVDQSIEANVYVASMVDVQRQYATVNMLMVDGTSPILIADLRRNNGQPMIDVPALDVTLVNVLDQPVGDGPYFVGLTGDIALTADVPASVEVNGSARVAFLNVPPGTYTLLVNYLDGENVLQTMETPAVSIAGTVTLMRSGGLGGGGGGGGGPQPANLDFRTDVYPILQKASKGGDACANCHTSGGLGAINQFDLAIEQVHQALLLRPNVVNIANPELSLLLTKPLYEDPPNHPNATYLTADAANYQIMMQWIAEGAVL